MTPAQNSALLAAALHDAVILLESSSEKMPSHNMETILKNRLLAYYTSRNDADARQYLQHLQSSRDEIELLTAREALLLIQRIQMIIDIEDQGLQESPLLGTRDLAKIRTLLSLAFRWGLERLYARVSHTLRSLGSEGALSRNVLVVATDYEDHQLLSDFTTSLLSLIFPDGAQGRISQTLVTSTVLARHATDLLLPSITLGWLPEGTSTHFMQVFRPLVARMMRLLSPSQAISALGSIISSTSPPPPYVRFACTSLLTKQLLRPDGVQGLCDAMFSEEEAAGDEAQVDKLERIARIVNSVPSSLKPEEYYSTIFPRVLQVLTSSSQASHKRAAAFAIYRALVPKIETKTSAAASSSILRLLHEPLLETRSVGDSPSSRPRTSLEALATLLRNAEPSPPFISRLLSPIISSLYSLSYALTGFRAANPQLKESVLSLLKSWAIIVDKSEGESVLWSILESDRSSDWKVDLEGNFYKVLKKEESEDLALLLPQNIKTMEESGDMNIFKFYPDPIHFVKMLKSFDRGDIASSLFVRLFELYLAMKRQQDQDTMKIFYVLQIIMQMQQRLREGTASSILHSPDKLFPFIHHVLASVDMAVASSRDEDPRGGDSDDEEEGPNVIGPDDEMIETTITLFLSILEANEMVSVRKYPILNDIYSLLEPLASTGPVDLRPIVRKAKLVITARLAQSSGAERGENKTDPNVQEIYQRALKLLQDSLLPVRAHGLLLLRELLNSTHGKDQVTMALVPSILSIFLQSVQDDDSYIFLNAVQGLAVLVDRFGKEILQGLVGDYTRNLKGLGATNMTQLDIDVRTRIGEALSSVIKRCGSTLVLYDLLVPPLMAIIRDADVPTVLRTSSISLLADCVNTHPLAMLPYLEDLCFGFIDLLQLESVPAKEYRVPKTMVGNNEKLASLDSDPKMKNSKIPPLRRAALHFLTSFIRASTRIIYEGNANAAIVIPESMIRKAGITLGYISSTDEDNLVRAMAKEAKENLQELQQTVVGLSESYI